MPQPIPFTVYAANGGAPVAGIAGDFSFATFRRREIDGSFTDLLPGPAFVDTGAGGYEFVVDDSIVFPGTIVEYVISLGQNSSTQYLDGIVQTANVPALSVPQRVPSSSQVDFRLKANDKLPSISDILKNPDGSAMNLTGASVTFRMRPTGGALKVNAAATVVDAVNGVVRYDWRTGDTDTPDLYSAEWAVSFAGAPATVPNEGFLKVLISPSLA